MKKRIVSITLAMVLALSLAISSSAAESDYMNLDNESIEMIEALFQCRENSFVFEQDGTDITNSFLARHQTNYEAGNFSAIIDDFMDKGLSASYPDLKPGIMPRLTVNYSGTTNLTSSFIYLGKTYKYTVGIKVTGTVNDYNFNFQTLNKATKTKFSSDLSSATLSTFDPYGITLNSYLGRQFVKIGVSFGGQSLVQQWRVTANAKDGSLSGYLAP